jgi:hypothetical protein
MSTPPAGESGPEQVYRARRDVRRAELQEHERRDRGLSILRAVVAVLGLMAWAAWPQLLGPGWMIAAVIAFLALVVVHEVTARARARSARRVAFYDAGLARLHDEWAGRGEPGTRFLDPAHPYAADLDLFGSGSLYERLCTARTRTGQDLLASWLLSPAPVPTLRERQASVDELRQRGDLREDLAVLGTEVRGAVDSTALRAWAALPTEPVPVVLRAVSLAVSAFAWVALYRWLAGQTDASAFLLAFLLVIAVTGIARRWTTPVLDGLDRPARDLDTLSELFARVERERFTGAGLDRLSRAFGGDEARTSREVARLRRLVELHDSKRNVLFGPFAFLMLWDVHIAAAVASWRRRRGRTVVESLEALGEMEALCALATYAFESPADPFPELAGEGPLLQGEGMGHPLISEARSVRNDLRLDDRLRLLVVSGSNMSGKSTFLRTIGINVVLAQAGAPVRARALRLSPLSIGASIRIQDSLQEGRSRFYAEITRVRQIMDLAAGRPGLLFLLDEIFHGTNSADRRVGAEAVVRALVRHGAMGLVTSHDLALAEIADDLAPLAANVHFEDHLEGDRMAFDYRLKPGPVRKSNALGLMRAVGLEV